MVEYYHTNDFVKLTIMCNGAQRKSTFLIPKDAILPAVYLTEKYSSAKEKRDKEWCLLPYKMNKKTLLLIDGNLDYKFSLILLSTMIPLKDA